MLRCHSTFTINHLCSPVSPKLIPWFVSDVTPPDFKSTITSLLSPTFFPEESTPEVDLDVETDENAPRDAIRMLYINGHPLVNTRLLV